jgi:hypothetical protein
MAAATSLLVGLSPPTLLAPALAAAARRSATEKAKSSGSRVASCLIARGGPARMSAEDETGRGGSCGDTSTSGENMRELRVCAHEMRAEG